MYTNYNLIYIIMLNFTICISKIVAVVWFLAKLMGSLPFVFFTCYASSVYVILFFLQSNNQRWQMFDCKCFTIALYCICPGLHGGVNVSSGQRGPGSESRKCVIVWRAADWWWREGGAGTDESAQLSLGTSACGQHGATEQVVTCLHDEPLFSHKNINRDLNLCYLQILI